METDNASKGRGPNSLSLKVRFELGTPVWGTRLCIY